MKEKFIEAGVTLLAGLISAAFGWFGWVLIIFCIAMVIDYITGTAAALKSGEWSSKVAREGIWHKFGTIMTVVVAIIIDALIGLCVGNIELSISYTVLISPIVTVWYIITEAGSIVENTGKLGAAVPKFLTKAIASLKVKVDEEEKE